jgi:predicted transcriptional regulator
MPNNLDLFPKRTDFRVVAIRDHDFKAQTDDYAAFRRLVLESEAMYPHISTWLSSRVVPELTSGTRLALVAYESDKPVASVVLKLGESSKFCHVRVTNLYQDLRLGELFFALMGLGCRKASEIHFTLPESLWEERRRFFAAFGFDNARISPTQYRPSERELVCSAPASVVVSRALDKATRLASSFTLSGKTLDAKLIMSLAPRHAHAVMSGDKQVEVRRRFARHWEGATMALYATRPEAAVVGQVTVSRVVHDSPENIWRSFGEAIGCDKSEFLSYVGCEKVVAAILLSDPEPYLSPIPIAQLSHWCTHELIAPQSYQAVDAEDPWGCALMLASLLHGRFASGRRHKHLPRI